MMSSALWEHIPVFFFFFFADQLVCLIMSVLKRARIFENSLLLTYLLVPVVFFVYKCSLVHSVSSKYEPLVKVG